MLREVDAESTRELAARIRLFDDGNDSGRRPLAAVEQAIVEGRVLDIHYTDKTGDFTARTIEPVAVLGVQPFW